MKKVFISIVLILIYTNAFASASISPSTNETLNTSSTFLSSGSKVSFYIDNFIGLSAFSEDHHWYYRIPIGTVTYSVTRQKKGYSYYAAKIETNTVGSWSTNPSLNTSLDENLTAGSAISITTSSSVPGKEISLYTRATASPVGDNLLSNNSGRVSFVTCAFGYNLVYNANGGSGAPASSLVWTNNTTHTFTVSSGTPTRTGYTFKGWSTSSTGSVNYVAYSSYSASGATLTTSASTYKTITLYAVWEPIPYTATFNYSGGSGSPTSQTFNIEGSLSMPGTPTKAGYAFAGWKVTTAAGNWSSGTTYSAGASVGTGKYGNVTFTAQWTSVSYIISYYGNNSTSGSMQSDRVQNSQDFTLSANAFERKYIVSYDTHGGMCDKSSEDCSYQFVGWEDHSSVTYNGTTYSYTQFDAPYYANAYSDLFEAYGYNKYNLLHHYVNYGKGEGRSPVGSTPGTYPDNATVNSLAFETEVVVPLYAQWTPQSVILPTPTRPGYVFNGWYTEATGGTKVGDGGASYTPTADVTLHAQWTEFDKGNLTVTVTGLANNDSAVCTVVSSVDGSRYVLSLTAAKNSDTIKDVYVGEYTVSTGGWQWNYTLSGESSRSATLIKGATSTVTFNLSTKADTPKHDSHYKENILK